MDGKLSLSLETWSYKGRVKEREQKREAGSRVLRDNTWGRKKERCEYPC